MMKSTSRTFAAGVTPRRLDLTEGLQPRASVRRLVGFYRKLGGD